MVLPCMVFVIHLTTQLTAQLYPEFVCCVLCTVCVILPYMIFIMHLKTQLYPEFVCVVCAVCVTALYDIYYTPH